MNRPGLSRISYRVGDFTTFRRELFDKINQAPELSAWTYRGSDDPGIALLEGQAMAADVLTAYQEIFANEAFLNTAQWEQSVAGLTRLLGERAAPGRGGQVAFAFEIRPGADITLPAGFPMISELEGRDTPVDWEGVAETVLKPSLSRLQVEWPKDYFFAKDLNVETALELSCLASVFPRSLPSSRLFVGFQWATTSLTGQGNVTVIDSSELIKDRWVFHNVKVKTFDTSNAPRNALFLASPHAGYDLEVSLLAGFSPLENAFAFAGVDASIIPGDLVLLEKTADTSYQICRVDRLTVVTKIVANVTYFYTVLIFDKAIAATAPATNLAVSSFKIWKILSPWFSLTKNTADFVPEVTDQNKVSVLRVTASASDQQALDGRRVAFVKEGQSPEVVTLKKQNNSGLFKLEPALSNPKFTYDDFTPGKTAMTVFGNVLEVTQGKTEFNATLGSGDTSVANQTFLVPKAPLTYYTSPQLEVRVQGRPWTRVESFLMMDSEAEVYIVREDATGKSWIQFGDGVNGARLPTGPDNVTATYRVGLGARGPLRRDTVPRAGQKIDRLDKIHQLGEAVGGQDPESPLALRKTAPQKVRAMGRLVSLDDYETEVRKIPGVLQVQASWGGIFGEGQNIDFLIFANSDAQSTVEFIRDHINQLDRDGGLQRLNVNTAFGERVDAYLMAQVYFDPKQVTQADLDLRIRKSLGVWDKNTPPENPGLFSMASRTFGQNEYLTRVEAIIQNTPAVSQVKILKFGVYNDDDAVPDVLDPLTTTNKTELTKTALHPIQWLALRDDQTLFVWSPL